MPDLLHSGWPVFYQLSFIREAYAYPDFLISNNPWYKIVNTALTQQGEEVMPLDLENSMKVYTNSDETARSKSIAAFAIAGNFIFIFKHKIIIRLNTCLLSCVVVMLENLLDTDDRNATFFADHGNCTK